MKIFLALALLYKMYQSSIPCIHPTYIHTYIHQRPSAKVPKGYFDNFGGGQDVEKVAVAGNDDSGTSDTSTSMPSAATDFHPPTLDVNPMRSTSSGRSSSVIASPSGSGRGSGRGSEAGSGVGGGGESKMPGDAPLVPSVMHAVPPEEESAGGAEGEHLRRMKRRQEQHRNATFSGLVQREQLMQLLSTRAFHTDPQQVNVYKLYTVVRICTAEGRNRFRV